MATSVIRPEALASKVPVDVIDYSFDWTDVLVGAETIIAVTWTVPTPLEAVTASQAGAVTTQWIAGGVAGASYRVACRITTSGGRTVERSFVLPVVARL